MGLRQQHGKLRVVGIGEMIISNDPTETLITYSLGSCLGVVAWDDKLRIGGMIHCLLPTDTSTIPGNQDGGPARFVSTGVPALLDELVKRGSVAKNLTLKVAGAASPLQNCGTFRIGERNHAALRKVLWKYGVFVASERVGGHAPRTLVLDIASGRTFVRSAQTEEEI